MQDINNLNNTNETNETPVVKTVTKKVVRKAASKNVSADVNSILGKIFDEKKVDFDFGSLKVSNKLSDSLGVFNTEDLAVIVEEALKAIDVEKISQEYEKRKK